MNEPNNARVVLAVQEALVTVLPVEDLAQIALEELDEHTQLLSLPIDSVVLMSVMNELEECFSIFITEEAAFDFVTIGDIAQYIQNRFADKASRFSQPSPSTTDTSAP